MSTQTPSKRDIHTDTPDNVRLHREVTGKTRAQAADLVGVSGDTWKSWELGRRKIPDGTLAHFDSAYKAELDRLDAKALNPDDPANPPDDGLPPLREAVGAPASAETLRISEETLADPFLYSKVQASSELKDFRLAQDALYAAAIKRNHEAMAKTAEILKED